MNEQMDEFEELMFVAGNFIWSIGEIWKLISELEGEY